MRGSWRSCAVAPFLLLEACILSSRTAGENSPWYIAQRSTPSFALCAPSRSFPRIFREDNKRAAQDAGLIAAKADDIYGTRAVMTDIWEYIWKARAVVAIVTGKNPNVNYELGICHALGVPTVLISEKKEDVPFDYRHRRYIPYHTRDAGWERETWEDISKTLKKVLSAAGAGEELSWPYDTFDLSVSGRIGRLVRSEDARTYVAQGAELVSMSPGSGIWAGGGTRVSVNMQEIGRQMAVSSGARIAQRIKSGDPLKAQGVEQMARLAQEVLRTVGDSTKTSVFLSTSMLKAGDAALRAGHSPRGVLSGMRKSSGNCDCVLDDRSPTRNGRTIDGHRTKCMRL